MPETDTFFKYLLTLALSTNESLKKIIVVNRNRHTKDRYEQFTDKFFRDRHNFVFIPGSFESFLKTQECRRMINRMTFHQPLMLQY